MRTVTISKALYNFDELSDQAKEHAIQAWQEAAYEFLDTDDLTRLGVYILAEKFGSPGWDEFGSGDFPGIDGLNEEWIEWDHYRREFSIGDAYLDRDNAPNLPWPEDAGYARLGRRNREWTGNDFDLWYADSSPQWMLDRDREDVEAFLEAIRDAEHAAFRAIDQEIEYLTSEELAIESLQDRGEDFDEDGRLSTRWHYAE